MILTELIIQNVGPFADPVKVTFEDTVTVLTGANDSGKTSVLNAIELLFGMKGGGRILRESDVNLDRIGRSKHEWKKDDAITCRGTFPLQILCSTDR